MRLFIQRVRNANNSRLIGTRQDGRNLLFSSRRKESFEWLMSQANSYIIPRCRKLSSYWQGKSMLSFCSISKMCCRTIQTMQTFQLFLSTHRGKNGLISGNKGNVAKKKFEPAFHSEGSYLSINSIQGRRNDRERARRLLYTHRLQIHFTNPNLQMDTTCYSSVSVIPIFLSALLFCWIKFRLKKEETWLEKHSNIVSL